MQSVCELSTTALPYFQKLSYSKVSYSGGLCENCISYLRALNCGLCRAWFSVGWWSRGEGLDAALSSRMGPRALGKGLGSRKGTGDPFAAPFHTKAHIFLTSTCSSLLVVRLLSLSLCSDT